MATSSSQQLLTEGQVSRYGQSLVSSSERASLRISTVENEDIKCMLCNTSTVNELNFGHLYSRDGVTCHYYCLLFCSNLITNGSEDRDGIMGFLLKDIKREVTRVNNKRSKNYAFYKCRYCKRPGATVGCCKQSCRILFHFPCGLENGVNYQFTDKFACYCQGHAKENLPKEITRRMETLIAPEVICYICLSGFDVKGNLPVFGTCSVHEAVYHKKCIQEYAANAGYSFKCPGCAEKNKFKRDVNMQGVYVPSRDAAWEKEENAFQEHTTLYSKCDACACNCPNGRDYHDKDVDSRWRLLRCFDCAASAIHVECYTGQLECSTAKWICPTCKQVADKVHELRIQGKLKTRGQDSGDDSTGDDGESSNAQSSTTSCGSGSDESLFKPVIKKLKSTAHLTTTTYQDSDEENKSKGGSDTSRDESLFFPVYKNMKSTSPDGGNESPGKTPDYNDSVDRSSNENEDTDASSDDSLFIKTQKKQKIN